MRFNQQSQQPQQQKGFNLIELMIVVAVLGLLAAIALPNYQDYIVRTKIVEGMSLVTAAKSSISDAFTQGGENAITISASDWNQNFTRSKYVSQIVINTIGPTIGTVAIIYDSSSDDLSVLGTNDLVFLTPQIRNGAGIYENLDDSLAGIIDWSCTSSETVTSDAQGMVYTTGTLLGRYAPANCR